MRGIFEIVRARHSCRVPFDPKRCVSEQDLLQILEAARWAPTAQNICRISEIIAIDDKAALAAIGASRTAPSEALHPGEPRPAVIFGRRIDAKEDRLLATMFPVLGGFRMQNRRIPMRVTDVDRRRN